MERVGSGLTHLSTKKLNLSFPSIRTSKQRNSEAISRKARLTREHVERVPTSAKERM